MNRDKLNLYKVHEGVVSAATPNTPTDATNSILVAATSPENALKIAAAYDREEVTYDNLAWEGKTIAVVTMRDAEGMYL